MFSVKSHDCGDCRLACVDCNSQICPKCMVPCPVGNRCPKCAGKFTSHVLKISGWALARTALAALAAGYIVGALNSVYPLYGVYMMIAVYFAGLVAGNLIHRISGHKLGKRVTTCVLVGIVIGFAVSPSATMLYPSFSPAPGYSLVSLSTSNPEKIIQTARQKWPEFIAGFQDREPEDLFSVKAPIVLKDKPTAHEWVAVKEIKGDELTCEVPKSKIAQLGEEVKVSAVDIEDWQIQTANGTTGGFSLPASLPRSRRQPNSYLLMSQLFTLAAFCFGAVTPLLGGSGPNVRNIFRR